MHNDIRQSSSERAATLNAREAAALLNISQRHLWTLTQRQRMPAPIRLGRAVRWSRDELLAWVNAGAPDAATWAARKGGPAT